MMYDSITKFTFLSIQISEREELQRAENNWN